jgi:hypothetical protein
MSNVYKIAAEYPEEFAKWLSCSHELDNVRAERDTLRSIMVELHDALWLLGVKIERQIANLDNPAEGRKYLERMQRAIDDCES